MAIEAPQGFKAMTGQVAIGQAGVVPEQLVARGDPAVTIAIPHEQGIAATHPARAFREAIAVVVELDESLSDAAGGDTVAVEVEHQGGDGVLGRHEEALKGRDGRLAPVGQGTAEGGLERLTGGTSGELGTAEATGNHQAGGHQGPDRTGGEQGGGQECGELPTRQATGSLPGPAAEDGLGTVLVAALQGGVGIDGGDGQTQHQQALIEAAKQLGEPHPLQDLIGPVETPQLGHQQRAVALQHLLMAVEAIGGQEVAEGAIGGPFRQGGRSHGGQIGEEGAAVDLEETLAQDGIAGGIHGQAEMGELDFGVGGDQLEGLLQVEPTQQADRNAIDPGDVGIGQQCRQFRLGEHAIEPSTGGEGEHLPAGGSGEAGRNPIPDAIGDAIAVGVAGAVEIGDYFFAIP